MAFIDVARAWPDDLARDVRGTREGTKWLLEVLPVGGPVVLSWDGASLPVPLRLYQVAGPDPTGVPLAGTSVDMRTAGQLSVSGAGPQYFVITQDYQTFALGLDPGWTLISLPIEPESTAVGLVLSATAARAGEPAQEFRDGKRGVVYSGDVWQWDVNAQPSQYMKVTDLHALTGYWVFAPTAAAVTVRGLPPADTRLPLKAGWNLVGPPAEMDPPSGSTIVPPAWWWDGQRYRSGSRLYPGLGYWFFAPNDANWEFGR